LAQEGLSAGAENLHMSISSAVRSTARVLTAGMSLAIVPALIVGGATQAASGAGATASAAPHPVTKAHGHSSTRNISGPTAWDSIPNPTHNATPSTNYYATCWSQGSTSASCVKLELSAINHQHAVEGIKAMKLPANFRSLRADLQLLVIINQERVDRGLPALAGLNAKLHHTARKGAVTKNDPEFTGAPAGTTRWYGAVSNWAYDYGALGSDFDWMYNDGVGSGNLDCTSSDHSGCWGHRENILAVIPGSKNILGASQAGAKGSGHLQSDATIVVGLTGHPKLYGTTLGH
jgi:hypothetical protein